MSYANEYLMRKIFLLEDRLLWGVIFRGESALIVNDFSCGMVFVVDNGDDKVPGYLFTWAVRFEYYYGESVIIVLGYFFAEVDACYW